MNKLIEELTRKNASTGEQQAATLLQRQAAVLLQQRQLLDHCASLLTEAAINDAIPEQQRHQQLLCVDAIRRRFHELQQTTTEQYVGLLFDRIGLAVGIAPGTQFDPFQLLEHIRATLHAQQGNADRLAWTESVLTRPAQEPNHYQLLTPNGWRDFGPETPFVLAIDQVRAEASQTTPSVVEAA